MTTPFDYIPAVLDRAVEDAQPIDVKGKVIQVVGTIVKASVPGVKVGEICILRNPWESLEVQAEVVGFTKDAALLTALGPMIGISAETEVIPTRREQMVPVGMNLLGRVLDGLGRPMDLEAKGPLRPDGYYPVYASPPPPLERRMITKPISLGIRAIDGLLTCGEGQRMGIFAAAGGGKSTLLASIIRNTEAEVTVLALIGERGREVREFIEKDLGPEGLKKSVLVISTSDRPSMERLKAAHVATSIAESFRDRGMKVLLLMDSVTRFGRAQREIGLAAGEPPTRRGFPPSVFSELPKLMERAGNSSKGSITALYTVLVEGDDMTEPIADETRSILDGHIILSRKLSGDRHPRLGLAVPVGHHPERPQGRRREAAQAPRQVRRSRASAQDRRVQEGVRPRDGRGHRQEWRRERVPAAGAGRAPRIRRHDRKTQKGGVVMSYVLQPLLRIRTMREDRASGELSAARRELAAAEDALEARRRDLAAYEETKEERRDRIYDAIMGRTVSREQIDLANAGVARIDEEGALKVDNVARAEGERKKCEEATVVARHNLAVAMKNRTKIDEHKEVWISMEAAEEEHRAEGELEDFVVRKPEI